MLKEIGNVILPWHLPWMHHQRSSVVMCLEVKFLPKRQGNETQKEREEKVLTISQGEAVSYNPEFQHRSKQLLRALTQERTPPALPTNHNIHKDWMNLSWMDCYKCKNRSHFWVQSETGTQSTRLEFSKSCFAIYFVIVLVEARNRADRNYGFSDMSHES